MATLGTLKQSAKILSLFEDTPGDQIQAILEAGFLADLRDANVSDVNREDLRRVLGLNPLKPELKIWKTIKLGARDIRPLAVGMLEVQNLTSTSHLYVQVLESKKFRIGTYARQILDKVTVSPTETEIDLAVLTVADLGFKRATRYDVICKRIIEIGAQLCPAEVGPALRLSYEDQPVGEWTAIAMEPLSDSDGDLNIFGVGHGRGERWLRTCRGGPDGVWVPDDRFVVAVPRK